MKNGFSTTPLLVLVLLIMVLIGTSFPAKAHKVVASAYASGSVIEGEIGFSNGDMAANILVRVFDGSGNQLGETTTDGDGVFTFAPTQSITHVFRADLGAGHVAETTLESDELPDLANAVPSVKSSEVGSPADLVIAKAAAATAGTPPRAVESELARQRALIAEAVRDELRPLRREIAAYREKNDFQTILGGLGYIVGIFGFWFYIAARRKKRDA